MFFGTSILVGFWSGFANVSGRQNLQFFKIFGYFSKQISKCVLKSSKNASKAMLGPLILGVLGPRASLGGRGE